eukprot:CAMPEP_0194278756 /NCGR_PEP_ID=MMETSP0169-20130528/12029_1 /TAXON_ID=218684 /ORGANISM="Corethron pennatum, Strain L29A3" /LENGTH=254 /DNA_ID=CAMNT_0039023015 /DNA_START=53 /DNA_END=817 /DNA_ORIENTATION=+
MKILATALAIFVLIDRSDGFTVPSHKAASFNRVKTSIRAEAEAKKPLTAGDIIARARKAVGAPQEEAPPPVFEDESILDDIKSILMTLENRIKSGPGSIDRKEVNELAAAVDRVKDEMVSFAPPPSAPSVVDVTPPAPSISPATPPAQSVSPPSPSSDSEDSQETNDEFGADYAGRGGLGMARDTKSTYLIPGMEEMNPEEYRAALQKSVSARQEERRKAFNGKIGNRAGHQYLEQLGWGGASKAMGRGRDADE